TRPSVAGQAGDLTTEQFPTNQVGRVQKSSMEFSPSEACRTASGIISYFEWASQTSPASRPVETPRNAPAITSLTKCQSPAISSAAGMSSNADNDNILVR